MSHWLITGATSDIAQALACRLAEGNRFTLIGRHEKRLTALAVKLTDLGADNVATHVIDFSSTAHTLSQSLDAAICKEAPPTDLLVAQGLLLDSTTALAAGSALGQMLQVNTVSVALTVRAFLQNKARNHRARIVVLGSVAGDRARPSNFAYGASKASLEFLMQGFAMHADTLDNDFLLVKPGPVRTRMTAHLDSSPLWSEPGAVAEAIGRAIDKHRRGTMYAPLRWRWIMVLIRALPDWILQRLPI